MSKKDINFYISELKNNNPTDYFYEYMHEENQPVELIQAIIQLFKEGFLNDNNFSRICRQGLFLLIQNEENIDEEDIIFLLNMNIVPLYKVSLTESIINKVNYEVLRESKQNKKAALTFLLNSEINSPLLLELLIDVDDYDFNDKNIQFIGETFSKEFLIENFNKLPSLQENILKSLNKEELYLLINNDNLLDYLDHVEDITVEFLQDYIKIHYPKNPDKFSHELIYLHGDNSNWVSNFLKSLDFNEDYHYHLLSDNLSEHLDILKKIKDFSVIQNYYDRNIVKMTEENIELMLELSEQVSLNILTESREFSNSLLKKAFLKLDKYFLQGVNRIGSSDLIYKIDFKDLFYTKLLDKLLNGKIHISGIHFRIDSKYTDQFLEHNDEEFYIGLLQNSIEEEEVFIKMFNNIKSESLVEIAINKSIIENPVSFLLEKGYSIEKYYESIFENYNRLNEKEISYLIKVDSSLFTEEVNSDSIIMKYVSNLSKEFIIKNINLLSEYNIIQLIDLDIIEINDISHINSEKINSIVYSNIDFNDDINDLIPFLSERKLSETSIKNLMEDLTCIKKLKEYFPKIAELYAEESFVSKIIHFIYINLADNEEESFLDILLEKNPQSYVLREILKEFQFNYILIKKYISKKNILNREDLHELSLRNNIPIDYFIERIEYISSAIKIHEDSAGINLFLENGTKLITYSTFRRKFNSTEYEFTDGDYSVFNFLISNIVKMPKKLKARIKSNLDFELIGHDFDINISNLEDMKKWFDFYELETLEVDLIRISPNYIIDFGIGKDKREQTLDFLKEIRKLDISQLDNLIQDRKNFNIKRGYGVEVEFSVQCDSLPENYNQWNDLDLNSLINYIEENYSDFFADYHGMEADEYKNEERLEPNSGIDSLRDDFTDYLANNDLEDHYTEEEFEAIGLRLHKIISKNDKKRSFNMEQDYYSSSGETWDLKTDSSVENEEYGILGIEIASPILYGKEDLNVFKKIMKDFTSSYFELSVNNAGVHVHHDVRDYKNAMENDMQALKKELYPIQEMLFNVISPSRSRSRFCEKYHVEDLKYSFSGNKDQSINFKPNDTIEFRMKEGTADVDDIANWIALTHDITDKIVKSILNKNKKSLEKKKSIFEKIILAARAASKRDIVDKDQIAELMEMYNSAKEFEANSHNH